MCVCECTYIYSTFTHAQRNTQIFPSRKLSNRAWKLSPHMQALSIRICLLSNHNNYFIHKFQRILVCCWSHYIYRWLQQQTKIFPPALIENEEVFTKKHIFSPNCLAIRIFSPIFATSSTPKMPSAASGKGLFFVKERLPREIHICKKAFITRFVL